MSERVYATCCDAFARALGWGTDNEMYGALIYPSTYPDGQVTHWNIGCDLPPMGFCPWCGAALAALQTKGDK